MQIQPSNTLLWAVCTRCLARGWEEQAVSSSGTILSSQGLVSPLSAHSTAIREPSQPSSEEALPCSGKELLFLQPKR